jgi:hypothetical protein
MRRCVSSSLRPFGLQAAIFLDRCGFIVRLGVDDEAHQGEWKVRDFVDAMLNFSLFRTMLSLTVDGTSLPIDIRHVYRLIDEANDSSREPYTLTNKTVKKILVAELVPPALVKTKRLLLSHFCMGTFFALLAAGLDDRFGTLKFLVHPEYVASAGSALRFLMSNREAIEVRFRAGFVCAARGRDACVVSRLAQLRAAFRPRFRARFFDACFFLQRVMNDQSPEGGSAAVRGAGAEDVFMSEELSDAAPSDCEARAAARSRVWAAFSFPAPSPPPAPICRAVPAFLFLGFEGWEFRG